MGELRRLGGVVRILHHNQLALLQCAADARQIRHARGGVGADDPDRLNLTPVDRVEHADGVVADLGNYRARRQAPDGFHVGALFVVGDRSLAGQQVAHIADIAPAHGVGLAGQTEGPRAGFADTACRQVQVDNRVARERTL